MSLKFNKKDLNPIRNVLEMLGQFYIVSGLQPNLSKSEIAGINSRKDDNMTLCGLKSLYLTKESIKR